MRKLFILPLAILFACGSADTEETTIDDMLEAIPEVVSAGTPEFDTLATVRHILIGTEPVVMRSIDAARSKADSVVQLLADGANWDDLVVLSDDPGSVESGGLYEDFPKGMMVPAFDAYSFSGPINSVKSVQTNFGFHVMEVLSRKVIPHRNSHNIMGMTCYDGDTLATARHILVGYGVESGRSVEAARLRTDSIVDAMKAGSLWEDVISLSDDPGSSQTGGVYSDFPRNMMVPAFENYCFNSPFNTVGVVETQYGFHIIEVLSRRVLGEE